MKSYIKSLIIFCLSFSSIFAQVITGRIIDQYGHNLPDIKLDVYANQQIYTALSDIEGYFSINMLTGVNEKQLPEGFSVSNNFPNPFNPKTRIDFTIPGSGNVKIEVYNAIGQKVLPAIDKSFPAGSNYVVLEMNGLANGIYIAKFVFENKYTVIKKLMLLYGSQHLSSAINVNGSNLSKSAGNLSVNNLKIDSIVASGPSIGIKTLKNLPDIIDGKCNLGTITLNVIFSPCLAVDKISYFGKVYNTVKIGNQCWLRENLDVGNMVQLSLPQTDNNIIEKYCYNNDAANCTKYGGLYQWDETMLYTKSTSISSGICPYGFRIPGKADFDTLLLTTNYSSDALLAIGQCTGTNSSGFSALLAGVFPKTYDPYFIGKDSVTLFWTKTSYNEGNSGGYKYYLNLNAQMKEVQLYFDLRGFAVSIRCIKDDPNTGIPEKPILISPLDNAINVSQAREFSWSKNLEWTGYTLQIATDSLFVNCFYSQSDLTEYVKKVEGFSKNTTYYWRVGAVNGKGVRIWSEVRKFKSEADIFCPGVPTVEYAGKTYNTVQIGKQCWLKENLNVGDVTAWNSQSDNSIIEKSCYDNNLSNCEAYGGLYKWGEAMQYSTKEKAQGICPAGWHIPSISELDTLYTFANRDINQLIREDQIINSNSQTNKTGFSAVLAGGILGKNASYYNIGRDGTIWSSNMDGIYSRWLLYLSPYVIPSLRAPALQASSYFYVANVRCIKND